MGNIGRVRGQGAARPSRCLVRVEVEVGGSTVYVLLHLAVVVGIVAVRRLYIERVVAHSRASSTVV